MCNNIYIQGVQENTDVGSGGSSAGKDYVLYSDSEGDMNAWIEVIYCIVLNLLCSEQFWHNMQGLFLFCFGEMKYLHFSYNLVIIEYMYSTCQ